MSTNPHQTQSKPDGYPAPPIPRNMFQGAKGVIINGGTLSTTFGSSTVVNNYNIKHQYPGGPVPSRAYGYTNGSNFFIGGGGSTYTTYYSSQPNSYTVLPSAGITMETHTGDQMFSGTFPGNSINLHNSPHATTVCNESVISISSLGSSTRVRQGHPQIYMSGANGFPFAPSTPSSRDAQWSQGQDRTTRRQGGTARGGKQDTLDELNSQDQHPALNESGKNVKPFDDIQDPGLQEESYETDEGTIQCEGS